MIKLTDFEDEVLATALEHPEKINSMPSHVYEQLFDYLTQEGRFSDMFNLASIKSKVTDEVVKTTNIIRKQPWTIDEVFNKYKEIIDNEQDYSDQALTNVIRALHEAAIPVGFYIISDRLLQIIRRRVQEYCEYLDMDLDDYDGPLPFKQFKQ